MKEIIGPLEGKACKCGCGLLVSPGCSYIQGHWQQFQTGENANFYKHGHAAGYVKTREYNTWGAMISRCEDTRHKSWRRYGKRGIRVCERWHSFELFLQDMGPRPLGCSLDRINNDGNYEPENCRWATAKEQAQNRPNSITLTIDGVSKNLSEWARESSICWNSIRYRLKKGWSHKDAVFKEETHRNHWSDPS